MVFFLILKFQLKIPSFFTCQFRETNQGQERRLIHEGKARHEARAMRRKS